MPAPPDQATLQNLVDRSLIQDVMARYARGVDRSDWALVRSAYHDDAYDDHGGYKGGVDGLIAWLEARFADAPNGMHFLGNSLIEFAGSDLAVVETYFTTQRLSGEGSEVLCRQSWGRYADRFERRNGEWRVSHRTVVLDSVLTTPVQSAPRNQPAVWSRRDRTDRIYQLLAEVMG